MVLQRAVGFGLLLPLALASSAAAANRSSPLMRPRPAIAPATFPRRLVRGRSAETGCNSNYATAGEYFVAVTAAGGGSTVPDVAGGEDSSVLAGNGNESCGTYSSIATGYFNVIDPSGNEDFVAEGEQNRTDAVGAFIGGRSNVTIGDYSFVGSGYVNDVSGNDSFIGAGDYQFANEQGIIAGNSVSTYGNQISGTDSFIGAGDLGNVSGNGSFIGGGDYTYAGTKATSGGNTISSDDAFIGAGDQNTIAADEAFIGAGGINLIGSSATYGTILGGQRNRVTGEYASVLGGFGNLASGSYAIVAGGDGDTAAGTVSFAAGYHADAAHSGSFVWSDYSSGSTTLKDTAANQFVVRASGGTTVYSNEGATSGVHLAAGSGTWASLSDRNAKTGIAPLDDASVLAKVAELPVSTWRYKTESGVRHVGPMAQDFYAAFGVGEDNRHITSIDEDGVALAAIKALHRENGNLREENASLHRQVSALRSSVTDENRSLRSALAALAARVNALSKR